MNQKQNNSLGFAGVLTIILLTIVCIFGFIYFLLNKDSILNKNKVNEDAVSIDQESVDDSRSILSLVGDSRTDSPKVINQQAVSRNNVTASAPVAKAVTSQKINPTLTKSSLSEFDSSKISAKQFDFYKFKYPNNWYLAFSNSNDVALTDTSSITRESFRYHAEIAKKPFLVILMSTIENASYARDTYDAFRYVNGKRVAWKLEAAPHLDSSPDDLHPTYILSYILTTPYTNKQSVYFAIGPITDVNKAEFTKIIEQVISSYTVTESPIGIEHRKLESEGKI